MSVNHIDPECQLFIVNRSFIALLLVYKQTLSEIYRQYLTFIDFKLRIRIYPIGPQLQRTGAITVHVIYVECCSST